MNKRLYKSRDEKMIDGVCGGIAEYFDIDPTLVRLIWAVFGATGGGILAYGAIMGASLIGGLFEGVLGFMLKPLRQSSSLPDRRVEKQKRRKKR